jgi:hypothetical protein
MQYSSISSSLNSKHPTGKTDMPFSKEVGKAIPLE